jgi:hypothetical protein
MPVAAAATHHEFSTSQDDPKHYSLFTKSNESHTSPSQLIEPTWALLLFLFGSCMALGYVLYLALQERKARKNK